MAGGEEGDGRLRVGPYLQGNESPADGERTSPASDAPGEITQSLPVVPTQRASDEPHVVEATRVEPGPTRVESGTGTPAVVRAVAKRAAAALPALGPATGRSGVRRGRARVVTPPPAQDPAPDADAPASGPGSSSTAEGDMQVSMEAGRSTASKGGTVYGAPPGRHADLDASGEEGVGDVDDRAAAAGDQSPDNKVSGPGTEPPRPGLPAFANAQTDEWILPTPAGTGPEPEGAGAQSPPWHELGRAARSLPRPPAPPQADIPRSPAYANLAADPVPSPPPRPGPVALDEDNWEGEPPDMAAGEYGGRRRDGSVLRTWIGVVAAVVVLGAAIGLPFLLHSSTPAGLAAASTTSDGGGGDAVAPVPAPTTPGGELGDPASAGPASPGASVSPGTPASSASTSNLGAPPPTTTSPPAAPQPPPPFPTTTIQAESGTFGGGVGTHVLMCSGSPTVVGPLGSDLLTIPGSIPTTGTYKVQVIYTNPWFGTSGSVSANGGTGKTFNVGGFVFCPPKSGPTLSVTLHAGAGNTIRITGNNTSLNIDKIIVSQA